MSQSITVSVIIVSWNAKAYLAECLQSLSSQTDAYSIEIIVVDNASADGSPEMAERDFPHVRVIRTGANLGFAKANNIGIKASTGKYLALINSDVNVDNGSIKTLVDYMEVNPAVGIAGPKMLDAKRETGRSCRGFPTVWNMFCHALGLDVIFPKSRLFGGYILRYWLHDTTREVGILGGWFWLIRRQAMEQVGLLDEYFFFYGEDMDWCKRFHLGGWKVMFVSYTASVHYGGGSSKQAPLKYYIQQQRADLQYWKKHHSRVGQLTYYWICILFHAIRMAGNLVRAPFSAQKADLLGKATFSWQCLRWYLSGAK